MAPATATNVRISVIRSIDVDSGNRELYHCVEKRMGNKHLLVPTLLAACVALALSQQVLGEERTSATRRSLALVGATVYVSPTEPAIKDGVVVVQEGTIAAVGRTGEIQLPADIEKL